MKKKNKIIWGSLIGLLLLGTVCGGTGYYYLLAPQFFPTRTSYIYIDKDDTADSIFHKVKEKGAARELTGFQWMAQYKQLDQHLHTGCYPIYSQDNVYHVFSRILRGYQSPVNLTIGSVRTLDKLAKSMGKQLMLDSADIARTLADTAFIQQLGYTPQTLPALFIPDTYQVYWDIDLNELFQRIQKEHKRFWNETRLKQAEAIGLTPVEVSTLASIVEEETNNASEKPMVAGLYLNRLQRNIPLQADPTVKFALNDFQLKRILNQHLTVQSPYNTYVNPGLPPGPIRIPSKKGIESVLHHTKHNYLYMCAKEDFSGTHNFAANYAEHVVNAQKYWRALNNRKIFK